MLYGRRMTALDVLLPADLAGAATTAGALTDAGADGLFTYEGAGDVFFPLVRAADATTGMLYTNIAVALPRSPMHLAYQAWDLQRLTDGRFALGIGSQIKAHIERRYGSVWERPLAQMREMIDALEAIFTAWQGREPLNFVGRWTRHTLMPPTLTPAPLESGPPPIWLAALGPRMTRLAGERADGLLVHPFTSARHVESHTMANLEDGLSAGGRQRDDVTVVVGAIVGVHDGSDEGQARADAVVRGTLGFYGSTPAYRPVLDTHGWGELQPELRALTRADRWAELGGLLDDEQVATLAIAGDPDAVGAELARRFCRHADRIALSLPQGVEPALLRGVVDAFQRENGRLA